MARKPRSNKRKTTMRKRKAAPGKVAARKKRAKKSPPKKKAKKDAGAKRSEKVTRAKVGAAKPKAKAAVAAKPPFYITTAIAYPNGAPHIGHAYEAIATDAIARFMRLDGNDVYFLTGTDEHGQKMQQTANKEGMTPGDLVERNVPRFQAMVERMECSNDDFIRTTQQRHYRSSAAIWERMEKAGDI